MFQMHPTQVKQIHLVSLPNKKEDKGMYRFWFEMLNILISQYPNSGIFWVEYEGWMSMGMEEVCLSILPFALCKILRGWLEVLK